MRVPGILDDWQEWKSYLEECSKEDFYKTLKCLTDRRNQAINIMSARKLSPLDANKPMTYKSDRQATSNFIPQMPDD